MLKKIFFLAFSFLFLFQPGPARADDSYYSSDDAACYYQEEKIPFCNQKNFQILGDGYAKDNIRVYYRGERLEGADTVSFGHVAAGYARDRLQVFLDGVVLPQADPASIEHIIGDYARDGRYLFYGYELLPGFDPASFETISQDYAKDKNFVYYQHQKIEGSHPLTFRLMADDYAKDLFYYYRYGQAIAKSSNAFYERYRIKDLSDTCPAESLPEIFPEEAAEPILPDGAFSRAGNCIYFGDQRIENSHAASFEAITKTIAKDKNFVYAVLEGEVFPVPYADALSFSELGNGYYRDRHIIYYGDSLEIINGADPETFRIVCAGDNCTYEAEDKHRLYSTGLELALDEATKQLVGEAKLIQASPSKLDGLLSYNSAVRELSSEQAAVGKYLDPLLLGVYSFTPEDKQAILNFIVYGTQTTRSLGAGERAGVLNSYRSAFGRLPRTEQDWADLVKIANGRWPTERNEIAEERAEGRFRYIYRRTPLAWDRHDESAITIIAYGLRTRSRNFDSEKSAILTFRKLFMDYPSSASDWDMVRAIAYSGATR